MLRLIGLLLLATALVTGALPVEAHFSQGAKLRTILITTESGETRAYIRTPVPLLFSDVVRDAQARQRALETPFLYLEDTGLGLRYRVSLDAIESQQSAFQARLEDALTWRQNGQVVDLRLLSYRLIGRDPTGSFSTIAEAQDSLAGDSARIDPVFGNAVVEVAFVLSTPTPDATLEVRSAIPELPLPPGVSIDNHLIDARSAQPVSYTVPGQLTDWASLDGSSLSVAAEFIWQGVLHIVEGLDHVLLVVCLALGIGARRHLIWLVTAFTLGHSVTLIGTFLGAAPTWPWFIPAVEASIAATVLYAAVAAYRQTMSSLWIIAAIGLLHGFGFSFVLGDILGRESPGLLLSLAAFNIGIEIGQLAIIAVTLAALMGLNQLATKTVPPIRTATLAIIGLIAATWVVERTLAVV